MPVYIATHSLKNASSRAAPVLAKKRQVGINLITSFAPIKRLLQKDSNSLYTFQATEQVIYYWQVNYRLTQKYSNCTLTTPFKL